MPAMLSDHPYVSGALTTRGWRDLLVETNDAIAVEHCSQTDPWKFPNDSFPCWNIDRGRTRKHRRKVPTYLSYFQCGEESEMRRIDDVLNWRRGHFHLVHYIINRSREGIVSCGTAHGQGGQPYDVGLGRAPAGSWTFAHRASVTPPSGNLRPP